MATYKTKKPYMYGTGRRKSSVARVHLIPNGSGVITVNGRDIDGDVPYSCNIRASAPFLFGFLSPRQFLSVDIPHSISE